jgi:hypothetical protein
VFPWLRLARVGFGLTAESKVDLLATTRVHFRVWPNDLISTATSITVAISRLIGWNRKWGFLEHRFVRKDRVIGVVAIRGVFKGPAGPLDPGVLLAGVAHSAPSPELPEWANRFHQGGELLSALLREEERLEGASGSKR